MEYDLAKGNMNIEREWVVFVGNDQRDLRNPRHDKRLENKRLGITIP